MQLVLSVVALPTPKRIHDTLEFVNVRSVQRVLGSCTTMDEMGDADGRDFLRVTTCDAPDGLRVASGLFTKYRAHYGQSDAEDGRTFEWLCEMVDSGRFQIFAASLKGRAVGIATAHEVPASMAMKTFWQLRDLYVLPEGRRVGAGRALVLAVRAAAERAGAARLSLVTEPGNSAALALYDSLGFKAVDGLVALSLGLST